MNTSELTITAHAIVRFAERVEPSLTNEEIERLITGAIVKPKRHFELLDNPGTWEYQAVTPYAFRAIVRENKVLTILPYRDSVSIKRKKIARKVMKLLRSGNGTKRRAVALQAQLAELRVREIQLKGE